MVRYQVRLIGIFCGQSYMWRKNFRLGRPDRLQSLVLCGLFHLLNFLTTMSACIYGAFGQLYT